MLHTLLNLTRNLILFDCETTGTDVERDRIVELGFQLWTSEGMQKEWRSLVQPGVSVPADVAKIHGISDAMLASCRDCGEPVGAHSALPLEQELVDGRCAGFRAWPHFKDLAESMAKGFVDCDFAGKNVRFDLRIFANEMQRAGVKWSYANARIIDADRLEQLAVPRTLEHLHEKYVGEKHDGAHGALSDVRATATVLAKQLEAHPGLPRDLEALHNAQWPGWIDGSGKFRFVNGVACFSQWGKFAGRAMTDPEVSRPGRNGQNYWDFIIGANFPEDVKEIARKAKLKQFPEMSK